MSISTRQCIVGEIASQPQWSKTGGGTVRLFARIRIRARRRQPDGTYGDPVDSFHNLVAFGRAAERGRTRLREGDVIVAAGYVRSYSHDQDGQVRTGEEFVMRWFGHEAWRTQYTVTRTATSGRLPVRPRTRTPSPPPPPLARVPSPAPAA